jgi:hypothetical protein
MFLETTNFDQPRLYCNWKDKVEADVDLKAAFCIEGGTCELNEDCSTPSPTPAPTANGGGGKTAHFVLGALFILLIYYYISPSTNQ